MGGPCRRMKAIAQERRRFAIGACMFSQAGRLYDQPQEALPVYREEKLAVAPPRRPQKRAIGTRAPMLVPISTQRALVARLCLRPAHRRPSLPHPDRGR